jgi:hypothetical protein
MFPAALRVHDGLFLSGRVPALSRPGRAVSALEIAALLATGAGAAVLATTLNFSLRIPGHAIVRSVFPMALGMALVPRRLAGSVMGASALATSGLLRLGGAGMGAGALTSLCLTGPLLDLALLGARRGWRLYLGFVLAGLGSNLAALVVRGGLKVLALGLADGRAADEWWRQAVLTYPLCGVLAGLLSALVWFQFRGRRAPPAGEGDQA